MWEALPTPSLALHKGFWVEIQEVTLLEMGKMDVYLSI